MKIFSIVLNYKDKKNTIECLKSLLKIQTNGFVHEVLMVDNGSNDGSVGAVEKDFKDVKVIKNKKNLGFAGGNNKGIEYALEKDAGLCLIVNNDTIVEENFLVQLIKLMEENKKIGIVSPKIYFAAGFEYHKKRYKKNEQGKVIWYAGGKMDWNNMLAKHIGVDEVDRGQYDLAGETDFATGCCMLVKRRVFEKIGLLDERYFLYWEDNDFCKRAKRAGFKVYFGPKSVVWHKNAGASGVGGGLQDYYISRNRMLFGMRWAPIRTKINLIKESVVKLARGRKWERIGVRDFYLGRFGKGSHKKL